MISPQAIAQTFVHPKPIYSLSVDGADITATLQGRLVDLTLTDNRGFEADTLDLRLDDTDGMLDLPPRGATIRLLLGWQDSGLVPKGSYTVDEVEHSGTPDTLSIRARSADLRSGLTTQRERSWHDVTLGDIVATLAAENALQPAIQGALAGQRIAHIDQTNESAVNLLTRLANQFDAIATVKDGRLLFIPAAGGVSASGRALSTVSITREVGDQHRFSIADRDSYSAVKALYHDVDGAVKGEVIWGKEENSAETKIPAKPDPTPPTGQYKDLGKTFKSRTAAQKAARKAWQSLKKNKAARAAYIGVKAKYDDRNLGTSGEVSYGQIDDEKGIKNAGRQAERDKAKIDGKPIPKTATPSAFEHSADNVKTLRHVYASKTNAQRAARAEWRRIQRGVASFSITLARGRPEIFPDQPAIVSGFKPAIDNTDWILTKVTHTLGDGGFTTALELEIKATEIPD